MSLHWDRASKAPRTRSLWPGITPMRRQRQTTSPEPPSALHTMTEWGSIHETSTDVIGGFDRKKKDSAIADLTGSSCFRHDLNNVVDLTFVGNDLDRYLRQQRYLILHSAINRRLSLLMAVSTNVG